MSDVEAHESMLRRLRALIDVALAPLIPPGGRVVLVDYPLHRNAGDAAIWLGEIAWLRASGIDVAFTCTRSTYRRSVVAKHLRDGTLLLHGGGNLGDVWPDFQRFRERVIGDFGDSPIVQLPQSVHFRDERSTARAARVFQQHGGVTVCVRDKPSRRVVAEQLGAVARLCPDMAFALGRLPRREASLPIMWLARQDAEAASHAPMNEHDVTVADWALSGWAERSFSLGAAAIRTTPVLPLLARPMQELFPRLAVTSVTAACETLGRGRVVVTDRLHGHILCCLLGIPHVMLDNSYGKLSRFAEAWTDTSPLMHRAEGTDEALRQARALAAGVMA